MDLLGTALGELGNAFALIFQPEQLIYLVLGVLLGLSVGVFPGLGGIAGLSLVLPFVYGMDPIAGLALMVGLIAVIPTSDTFASVLMGIPGSSASQATVLDGFPLAKKGQAARALSAAFVSSLFGGLLGATVLTFFILIARPLVLAFGLPEMLMITLLGLSMVAVLAGRLPLKGVAAACLGLLVGTIGEADAGGSLRMSTYDTFTLPGGLSFDFIYLTDGLRLVIVGLGIFAIPEIIALLRQDRSIAKDAVLGAGWLTGIGDWFKNLFLSIRCAVIGVIVGVIPGLGGSVVDWVAYGHTVQSSKDKSQFGSGDVRGIIGPESSNNAKEGGGLVPTLIFGIPGSGSMAVFIGAMALLGYDAGPQLLSNDLDVTYTIVWSLALANVVGAGLCILLSGGIARLTTIRFTLLAPFLFMMISFAAFQSRQSLGDLVALFLVGVLGIFLRRFDFSRPAFLIGFVLSTQAENFSFQAYQIAASRFRREFWEGMEYIFSPIVIVLLLVTVASVVVGIRQAKQILPEGNVPVGRRTAPLLFLLLVITYLAVSFFDAYAITMQTDRIFPLTVSLVGLIACVALLVRMVRAPATDAVFADREAAGEDADAPHGLWATLSWLLLLLVLSSLVGFILALAAFMVLFLRIRAGVSWPRTALMGGAGILLMCVMAGVLNRDFPPGLLQGYVNLPWPLGGN
ncbi:MAG: tripartite tricarboxylate transporter permease [Pseudomonadota bacterium]